MKIYELNGKRVTKSLEKKPVPVVLWSDDFDEARITSRFTGLDTRKALFGPLELFVTDVELYDGKVHYLPSQTWYECKKNHEVLSKELL